MAELIHRHNAFVALADTEFDEMLAAQNALLGDSSGSDGGSGSDSDSDSDSSADGGSRLPWALHNMPLLVSWTSLAAVFALQPPGRRIPPTLDMAITTVRAPANTSRATNPCFGQSAACPPRAHALSLSPHAHACSARAGGVRAGVQPAGRPAGGAAAERAAAVRLLRSARPACRVLPRLGAHAQRPAPRAERARTSRRAARAPSPSSPRSWASRARCTSPAALSTPWCAFLRLALAPAQR